MIYLKISYSQGDVQKSEISNVDSSVLNDWMKKNFMHSEKADFMKIMKSVLSANGSIFIGDFDTKDDSRVKNVQMILGEVNLDGIIKNNSIRHVVGFMPERSKPFLPDLETVNMIKVKTQE